MKTKKCPNCGADLSDQSAKKAKQDVEVVVDQLGDPIREIKVSAIRGFIPKEPTLHALLDALSKIP